MAYFHYGSPSPSSPCGTPGSCATVLPTVPELAVVIPTMNERDNIEPLLDRLRRALEGINWEVVFVDDDSTDGTSEVVRDLSLRDPRVRLLRRIRRRGLSSACIEGMMATTTPYLAVMDADLQHDETLLPKLLAEAKKQELDLVVASRNLGPGGMGEFAARRVRLSNLGAAIGRLLPGAARLTDPMSGFFLIDRRFLDRVVYRISGIGFKILLDLVASSPQPVRFAELPFQFRNRLHGSSKLDLSVSVEYLYLIADKFIGDVIPVRFAFFVLAGIPGLAIHLTALAVMLRLAGWPFFTANAFATWLAMTLNFFVNNWFTYRDQRLSGLRLVRGLLLFYAACSLGALASFSLAEFLYEKSVPWYLAGLLGMMIASVWNFGASRVLAWRSSRGVRQPYK
jgi:dolichol-phosphate mannosyltransferase